MKFGPNALSGLMAAAFASAPLVVTAFSSGAGTCNVTSAGPEFPASGTPHPPPPADALSSTDARSYQVDVDGTVLTEEASTDITLGGASQFTVGGGPFAGFLITLSASGKDLGGQLLSVGGNSQSLSASGAGSLASADGLTPAVCPVGVAGGTHTLEFSNGDEANNDDPFNTVTMQLGNIPPGPVDVTVTVMVRRRRWLHSNFVMNVLAGATVSTAVDSNATSPETETTAAPPVMADTTVDPATPPPPPPEGNGTDATPPPEPLPGNETVPGNETDAPAPPVGNGTDAPTTMPTEMKNETDAPTPTPSTSNPTAMPTMAPTPMPSTAGPTMMPSTQEPTMEPTDEPSKAPSDAPTTVEPTSVPTDKPTDKPTNKPTDEPTPEPTDEPSPADAKRPRVVVWTTTAAVVGASLAWMMA